MQSKHAKTANVPTPIERWDSIKRALRTATQVAVALAVAIAGGIAALAALAPEVLKALVDVLPPDVYAWLAGGVAFVVTLSGALARVMAIPAVDAWLTKLGLGSEPKRV